MTSTNHRMKGKLMRRVIIEEIDASNNCISLSNGNILCKGESQGGLTDEVMNFQIRKTDEEHLKKELRLNAKGIKALSLFFIDKVFT